ncbi:MAG: enolase C-terminal domain-like protein [Cyclobacteriaceae bacterium]|nr:enolase C-terminal domain-like protein [Cyclobacteriaceae bacterium]
MDRRNFLAGLGVAGALPLFSFKTQETSESANIKIRDVQMIRVSGTKLSFDFPYQNQANPLTAYQEFVHPPYPEQKKIKPEKQGISNLYLKITTDAGPEGFYGLVDPEAAHVVLSQLRSFLIGKNPLATETLWDQMYRLNRHSRAGHYMMAISAVDNALWDLKGKYFNAPVYKLLGGPTRNSIEFYASCLGFSVLPEDVAAKSMELKNEGYRYQKWFFANGLADGNKGLLKNVELVKVLRETLGEEYGIMFDAFNAWDLDYALEWAKLAEQYRPGWIEEAFISDKPDSFAELRRSTSIPVATGEHFYGRWEVAEYLKRGAVDYVQADPEWCGGVSELVKICHLASVFDVRVVPHGHNIHAALHVVASQSPATCPLGEFLLNWMPSKTHFEKYPIVPVNGTIALPDRPGFGIELDEKKVEKMEVVTSL